MPIRRLLSSLLIACLLACFATSAIAAKAKGKSKSSKEAAAAAPSPDDLLWRGDHATGRAIMEDLAKQYAKDRKGTIRLEPFSTLSGLDAVANGSADIAGSARSKYGKRAEEAGLNFVPVALDGAVLITHPSNPITSLTLKQIYDIYYGRIKNWKELGGADKDINLYAIASPLDGVEYSLRELVFRNGDQRVAAPRLYINTAKLEEAITLDPAGLGLSTMANTYNNKNVKMLSVEGVPPTVLTVADGSYPLFITLYLAEKADSPKHAAIAKFVDFLATPEAGEILRKHQLTPYADAKNIVAMNDIRMTYIDSHVGRDAAAVAAAALVTGATPTPVSAPPATPEAKIAIAPTAESTQAARDSLARADAAKAARKTAADGAAKETKTASAAAPAKPSSSATAKKEAVATAKKEAPAKKAAPKNEVAATKKPAVKKALAAAKAPEKTAAAKKNGKASVAAEPAKTPVKKKASFDNVTGGASGG